jgi:GrpB-like predicted nucleotidyltransferase (UPF0157 family)
VSFDPAIRMVESNPRWPSQANVELRRIAHGLGPLATRLEHIGSTAVPGLYAKPILDLLVSVAALEPHRRYVEPLERLGYLFVPDPDSPDRRFFARPPERPRSHHVHVCAAGSHCELRHIAVRDFLRTHPDHAASYATLKRELVRRHAGDRPAYIAGKDSHVGELEARALEWAKQRARHGAR